MRPAYGAGDVTLGRLDCSALLCWLAQTQASAARAVRQIEGPGGLPGPAVRADRRLDA